LYSVATMPNRQKSFGLFRLDLPPVVTAALFMLITPVTGFFLTVFFRDELGMDGFRIGLLVAVQAACGLLGAFPTGLANDLVTSRILLSTGLFGQALGLVFLAAAGGFAAALGAVFLWSLSNNLCRLSLDVQILKSPSGSPVARRLGLYHGARFLGLALGTLLAGVFLTRVSFRTALELTAAFSLLLVIATRFMSPTAVGRARLSDYRADLGDRRVIFFTLWLFLFCSHWGAEGTCYPLYLKDGLKLGMAGIGYYMAAEYLCVMLAVLLSAGLFEREPSDADRTLPVLLFCGVILSGAGQALLAATGMPWSVVFRMLHGLGDGVMMMFMYLGIWRLFPRQRLGGHTGFIAAVSMGGYIAGALIYGSLGERFGYRLPLIISGCLVAFLAVPVLRLAHLAEKVET